MNGPYGPEWKLRVEKPSLPGDNLKSHPKRISYAQVAQTLRRLGKAMKSDTFKSSKYSLSLRENRDMVGHASIRERVMQLLNIRLSDRDVTILMTRFDREEGSGSVDLVDILGNAKLYYSRSIQEQKMIEDHNRLKEKNAQFSKERRLARMEEKSSISQMLSHKIEELKDYNQEIDYDATLDDYSFVQDEERERDFDVSEVDKELDVLRDFAYNAMRSKKMRYLDAMAGKITSDQFREVLYIFGINSKESFNMLSKKYATSLSGVIDAQSFKHDFKSLAMNEQHRRKQKGAVSSFYKALGQGASGSGNDSSSSSSKNLIRRERNDYG